MEVHHHPDPEHKKKNFKEYFLENSRNKCAIRSIQDSMKHTQQTN